jgi:general L-amino acid transport system permease protein
MATAAELAYVQNEEEPILPAPRGAVGALAWFRQSLFSSVGNTIVTIFALLFLAWIIPPIVRWAFVDAVWTGPDREVCVPEGVGACWAYVHAKFAQFMYGRYPVDERWRVNLTGILLVVGLVPLAIPRAPFKRLNAIFLLGVFPVVAVVLLTGGHFDVPFEWIFGLLVVAALATGVAVSMTTDIRHRAPAGIVALLAIIVVAIGFATGDGRENFLGFGWLAGEATPDVLRLARLVIFIAASTSLVAGLVAILLSPGEPGTGRVGTIWIAAGVIELVYFALTIDFGLRPVETQLWGGLLVTLVVAIIGMVTSLPLGILLALGRRSNMPVVRFCSIVFIEFWRGVPLITVLFMASVMLPVFLPPGVTFDKLLRALIGVALFTSAYMAEVVRGGLQAIPRGQYEAARAMGLKYAPMMRLIVLPQALKIVIPGIVNSFISLFKDTSLVLIVGILDLLGTVQQGFNDANWASSKTPMTGYVFAAVVFWMFCFGMSRYSIYTENRLQTGHRRR